VNPEPTRPRLVHELEAARRPPSASETSIDSLCTSSPTNMLRFAMTCLRCVWLCPTPSPARVIHEYNVRQVSCSDSHTV
jgi:hypothetical protein